MEDINIKKFITFLKRGHFIRWQIDNQCSHYITNGYMIIKFDSIPKELERYLLSEFLRYPSSTEELQKNFDKIKITELTKNFDEYFSGIGLKTRYTGLSSKGKASMQIFHNSKGYIYIDDSFIDFIDYTHTDIVGGSSIDGLGFELKSCSYYVLPIRNTEQNQFLKEESANEYQDKQA